jgi:hypothetical protein
MQERQQQQVKQEMHVCQRCTGFAGATIKHKIGNCFSDGRTAIPDWFSTPHVGLLNELNRIRATRGQPLLTPRDPNAPKGNGKKGKPKVATPANGNNDATQLDDPDVPSGKRPRGEMAAMMTLVRSSHLGVQFDQHRREFTCIKCNRIMRTMHYPNGELNRIECSSCLTSYPATTLPEQWTQTSYWRSSGLEPISLRDISIPAGGFGSTISANLPVSETCNLAVEPPTIRPSVPRNFDWARTFDYRQPSAPNNERPLQAGSTSVLHGIRNDPKVQLGMLMTRVFKKGHNIDIQNEFDRLVAQLPVEEQVAQYDAFERARRSFTRTRVGTMPIAMLQSASGSGPFPAREGRAAAVSAWIPPIGPIIEHPRSEVNEPIGSPETFSVTTSAHAPKILVSTPCSESVLLRPDHVRASLMPNPVSRVSAIPEEHVEEYVPAETTTSSIEHVLRFTPRSVVNTPPVPVVNVPVQASRDPLSLSPRAHTSTSISHESRMEDLINHVKVELQGLKIWKEEAMSQYGC